MVFLRVWLWRGCSCSVPDDKTRSTSRRSAAGAADCTTWSNQNGSGNRSGLSHNKFQMLSSWKPSVWAAQSNSQSLSALNKSGTFATLSSELKAVFVLVCNSFKWHKWPWWSSGNQALICGHDYRKDLKLYQSSQFYKSEQIFLSSLQLQIQAKVLFKVGILIKPTSELNNFLPTSKYAAENWAQLYSSAIVPSP